MTRNQTLVRPPQNIKLFLEAAREYPKNAWFVHRGEHDQYNRMIKRFCKENPDANAVQESAAHILFVTYIQVMRCLDRRIFFSGETTGAEKEDCYYLRLSDEAQKRKDKEMRDYYFPLLSQYLNQVKICLANSIHLSAGLDLGSILDQADLDRLRELKTA